jgi:hypothetical protein
VEGVGVMKDEELKLEEIEVSHTLGGAWTTIREISYRQQSTESQDLFLEGEQKFFAGNCQVLKSVTTEAFI